MINNTQIVCIVGLLSILGLALVSINSAQLSLASSDNGCENQHEREDRFLDRYEADPDNKGKLQSFISSFQNGNGPC